LKLISFVIEINVIHMTYSSRQKEKKFIFFLILNTIIDEAEDAYFFLLYIFSYKNARYVCLLVIRYFKS